VHDSLRDFLRNPDYTSAFNIRKSRYTDGSIFVQMCTGGLKKTVLRRIEPTDYPVYMRGVKK